MALHTFISKQQVQFFDCDPMCVVWHGNYLKFLEIARFELLKAIGCSYEDLHNLGVFLPIVEERTKYLRSLRLSDCFEVHAHLEEFMNRLVFSYEIKVGDEVYVKAKTVQVAIDKNSGEMHFFLPEKLRNMISERLNVTEEL